MIKNIVTIIKYSNILDSIKAKSTYKINDSIIYEYSRVKLGGYNIIFKNDETITTGCKTTTFDEALEIIDFLLTDDKPKETWITYKGSKLCKESEIHTITDTHIITNNDTCFNISQGFEKSDEIVSPTNLRYSASTNSYTLYHYTIATDLEKLKQNLIFIKKCIEDIRELNKLYK